VTVLLLAGVGAAAAWARGSRDTPSQTAKAAAPVRPSSKSTTPATTNRSRESGRRLVSFTVESKPRATIYINDVRVGETPLAGHRLIAGREYRILLVRAGYRPKRETITATGSAPIKRSYVLQRTRR
jgi:hypothetical protein